jgi:hypothetical protein
MEAGSLLAPTAPVGTPPPNPQEKFRIIINIYEADLAEAGWGL